MTRATLTRVLLAVAIATATVVHEGHAQGPCTAVCPTPQPQPGRPSQGGGSSDSNNRVGVYILGGVVIAIVGWFITQIFSNPPPPSPPQGPPPLPPGPPNPPPLTQIQPSPPSTGPTALRPGCNLPPAGETRYVSTELVLESNASAQALQAIAARYTMTRQETARVRLTGRTLHRWRIDGGGSVTDMIRTVCSERLIAGLQPNYLYELVQAQSEPVNSDQYAPQKLDLPAAHRLATGNRVLIAVIDSAVDASHPDLAGAIAKSFQAAADADKPHAHGTGMAGAIAARHMMLGTAPGVGLLTVRAFSSRADSAEGTTFNIIKGLDWAAEQGARIVNMSFAGPSDPRLRDALAKANRKGMVLIAAAGNAGPKSPPLYPAADPNVIAVTATDTEDALFRGANRGDHIAVAAPGVDILAPAPDGAYQFTTGTSVAAAEVSGVAALLIERNPSLTPAEVRRILMSTAKDLGPKGKDRDFGAGLVNALQAVTAAKPR
jgi:hypothetical protein